MFDNPFYKILTNPKLLYKTLKWIPNSDVINFSLANKFVYSEVKGNKAILKNAIKNNKKEIGELLFLKDNYYTVRHSDAIQDFLIVSDGIYAKFSERSNYIYYIWLIGLCVLVFNIFFILLSLKIEQYFEFEYDWYVLTPISLFWFVTICTFSLYKLFITKRNEELEEKIPSFSFNNQTVFMHIPKNEKAKLLSSIIYRNQHFDSSNFERILRFIILFYLPIFIKYHFLTQFTNQTTFTFSGIFVLAFSYLWFLYDFAKEKCDQMNNKIKSYDTLSKSNEKFRQIYENLKTEDSKLYCFNEKMMTMLFFLSTAVVYVLWLYYFIALGAKLDYSISIINDWSVLFIPVYMGLVPLFIFCVMYGISQKTDKCNKIKIVVFTMLIYIGFLTNSILIPLRLDGALKINFLIIPSIFLLSSILIIVLFKCILERLSTDVCKLDNDKGVNA